MIGALLALGLFGTDLAFLLYFSLIERVGATNTSMVTYLVPIVGQPGQTALFTGPEVKAALEAKGLEGSLWRNQFAPRFVFALPRYAPGKLVERLGMPLLVCVADRDRETPADFAARVVERAPRGELRRYPASHFEVYHGEVFQRVLADQVDFLRSHLLSEAADRR